MSEELPGGDVARRDEILELLYWVEGEGFEGTATLEGLARFLTYETTDVRRILAALEERGDVVFDQKSGEYHLTDAGRQEAARRFAAEFAPLLSQGHGECNDPNCDCHTNPGGAADCHAGHTQKDHQH